MSQHIVRGYRPYTSAELAAAAERYRIDGKPPCYHDQQVQLSPTMPAQAPSCFVSRRVIDGELWVTIAEYARIVEIKPPTASQRMAMFGDGVRKIEYLVTEDGTTRYLYAWPDIRDNPQLARQKARARDRR